MGRAIAQAVSRRLPTAAALVETCVSSCGIFWWTKVALGQVFSENFGFPCQSTFHLLLHNHLLYHPRLAGRSGRSANSLTNQIKKGFISAFFYDLLSWMGEGRPLWANNPDALREINASRPSRVSFRLSWDFSQLFSLPPPKIVLSLV
jgi:hypothetical protein